MEPQQPSLRSSLRRLPRTDYSQLTRSAPAPRRHRRRPSSSSSTSSKSGSQEKHGSGIAYIEDLSDRDGSRSPDITVAPVQFAVRPLSSDSNAPGKTLSYYEGSPSTPPPSAREIPGRSSASRTFEGFRDVPPSPSPTKLFSGTGLHLDLYFDKMEGHEEAIPSVEVPDSAHAMEDEEMNQVLFPEAPQEELDERALVDTSLKVAASHVLQHEEEKEASPEYPSAEEPLEAPSAEALYPEAEEEEEEDFQEHGESFGNALRHSLMDIAINFVSLLMAPFVLTYRVLASVVLQTLLLGTRGIMLLSNGTFSIIWFAIDLVWSLVRLTLNLFWGTFELLWHLVRGVGWVIQQIGRSIGWALWQVAQLLMKPQLYLAILLGLLLTQLSTDHLPSLPAKLTAPSFTPPTSWKPDASFEATLAELQKWQSKAQTTLERLELELQKGDLSSKVGKAELTVMRTQLTNDIDSIRHLMNQINTDHNALVEQGKESDKRLDVLYNSVKTTDEKTAESLRLIKEELERVKNTKPVSDLSKSDLDLIRQDFNKQFTKLDERVDKLEPVLNQLEQHASQLTALQAALDQLDSFMNTQIEEFRSSLPEEKAMEWKGEVDKLTSNLGSIEAQIRNLIDTMEKRTEKAIATSVESYTELNRQVLAIANDIEAAKGKISSLERSEGLSPEITKLIEKRVTNMMTGDLIERPDLALRSGGAQIISYLTSPAYQGPETGSWLNNIAKSFVRQARSVPPQVVLEPVQSRGRCYCFAGRSGSIGVALPYVAKPSGFSIDHIAATSAVDSSSAPKDFEIVGCDTKDCASPVTLLTGTYQLDRLPVQTFDVPRSSSSRAFSIYQLRVKSNHGHPDFTCVYRFRVHGEIQALAE